MPGIVPAAFVNRLRALGFSPPDRGIHVIDVYIDIIAPEMAARGDLPPGILPGYPAVPAELVDPEAEYIRSLDRDIETPRTPQPGGGHLLDVTWAFNQATGARPLDDSAALPGRNRTRLSWLNEGDVLSLHAVGNALSVVLTGRCRRI